MDDNDAALLQQLTDLTDGLLFQSESDYPVVPFLQQVRAGGADTARAFVAAQQADPAAPVSDVDFAEFFRNATQPQEWHDAAARRRVKRFQALVKTLQANLTRLKVFKVGTIAADVYVIGQTAAGNLAGVQTKVVET